MPEGRESPEGRLSGLLRERWVDLQVDRMARRPWGRAARRTYGSPTSHDFLWPQLLEALELEREDRLLDVGCGGGAFMRHVLSTVRCKVAGVDHSRAMIRLAAPYAALGDAQALPFETGYFTAVASIQAFMFFPDQLQALREMLRVLDPERGRAAIWTAAPEAAGTPAAPEPVASRARLHDDEELVELARRAGFGRAELAARDEWAQLLLAQP
ncbi:MAG TPA: class I SAM-dependent methyltransferase [Gaiellaceae bacterium]|nr:class I SAM-dependent methyltransferase [Gaiellaceae bacterium]